MDIRIGVWYFGIWAACLCYSSLCPGAVHRNSACMYNLGSTICREWQLGLACVLNGDKGMGMHIVVRPCINTNTTACM